MRMKIPASLLHTKNRSAFNYVAVEIICMFVFSLAIACSFFSPLMLVAFNDTVLKKLEWWRKRKKSVSTTARVDKRTRTQSLKAIICFHNLLEFETTNSTHLLRTTTTESVKAKKCTPNSVKLKNVRKMEGKM